MQVCTMRSPLCCQCLLALVQLRSVYGRTAGLFSYQWPYPVSACNAYTAVGLRLLLWLALTGKRQLLLSPRELATDRSTAGPNGTG